MDNKNLIVEKDSNICTTFSIEKSLEVSIKGSAISINCKKTSSNGDNSTRTFDYRFVRNIAPDYVSSITETLVFSKTKTMPITLDSSTIAITLISICRLWNEHCIQSAKNSPKKT